jgi:hypothetical protein
MLLQFKTLSTRPKAALIGVNLKIQACAGTVAKAYKYTPMETVVYVNHDTVGWYVVGATRDAMRGNSWYVEDTATEKLKSHILQKGLYY